MLNVWCVINFLENKIKKRCCLKKNIVFTGDKVVSIKSIKRPINLKKEGSLSLKYTPA